MKFTIRLLAAAVFCLCLQSVHAQIVQPGARVAIVGDSITEQKIYSRYIEQYLVMCMPQLDARVMQYGWSGDRAGGFAGRMANDLFPFKPTVVTTCFGMNDGNYTAYTEATGKGYEAPMRDIVKRLKAQGATVIVGSPGAVDTKFFVRGSATPEVYNATLAKFRDIDSAIATEAGMPFANVHDTLIDGMAKAKAANGVDFPVCGTDGVHPNEDGHLAMAYAFLKAMGFDGDMGTISIDMNGAPTAVNGHKVLAGTGNKVDIESTRYPFCVTGDEKNANSNRSMLPFIPFNQELNRLTLTVKNLATDRAKVTWGTVSKDFTRAELEKGINLAAEFPVNPFSIPFQQVNNAIANKQGYETNMIKSMITTIPNWRRQLSSNPDTNGTFDALQQLLWTQEETFQTAVRAAVVPVKHTITVDAIAQ